jgi:integrase
MAKKKQDPEENEPGRAGNGESSIYKGADGYWHGRVSMGVKDDGTPWRPHIKRKDRNEVVREVRKLEQARDSGTARKPVPNVRFETWLVQWVEEIKPMKLKYTALRAYRNAVYLHLIPGLGKHWMHKLEPEHFEALYRKKLAAGHKPGGVNAMHRAAVTAINDYNQRNRLTFNPAKFAHAPQPEDKEIEPYDDEEIEKIITTALKRRNGVRFVIALALGIRQGEALGIKSTRLDRKHHVLRTPKQIQRHNWQHGCDDPHECGKRWHKTEPCPPNCHHKKCPPLCAPDCDRHGQYCPERHGGGLVEVDVKSRAGKRGIGIPDTLWRLIELHEAAQEAEKDFAGTEWQETGYLFTGPTGLPIDPRRDMEVWKDILREAGVRDGRLHDARHTAASVCLLLGMTDEAVMAMFGWSDKRMLSRYQHITDRARKTIASALETYFWGPKGDK